MVASGALCVDGQADRQSVRRVWTVAVFRPKTPVSHTLSALVSSRNRTLILSVARRTTKREETEGNVVAVLAPVGVVSNFRTSVPTSCKGRCVFFSAFSELLLRLLKR